MKKLILILVALIVLIAGGLVIFTMSIDWNEHKAKISAQFSELTGKRVEFSGPVTLSFLPSPNLTAQNVRIYSQDSSVTEPLAEVKSLVARLSLMPFLKGNFDVERMSLVNPEIRMIVLPDGNFNWKSEFTSEQREKLNSVEVKLDSVTLEKATVTLIDEKKKINWKMENLNAEIIADSALGPYRIEGSYLKDNNPEGFAINIGSLMENVATQVNVTFTNPTTQSYLRFDGSVLPNNSAVNGNIIFESQKLMDFVTSTFKDVSFDKDYDMPIAVSSDISTTKDKIELSNVVVKYGDTEAAGNIIIPRLDEDPNWDGETVAERQKIEIAFDAADLDLLPFVLCLKKEFEKYDQAGAVFNINTKSDIIADIKAIRAKYKDQSIRELELSFDILGEQVSINNFSAILPGNTPLKSKGSIYKNEDGQLYYDAQIDLKSDELLTFLKGIGIDPKPPVGSVYKRFEGTASVEGTLKEIKITPMDFTLDKSQISGDIAILRGEKTRLLILLEADNVNFDNYIPSIADDVKEQSFEERMKYRFSKLGFVNDLDVQFSMSLGLGIYEKIPFDNTQLEGKIRGGLLTIDNLEIGSLSNSQLKLSGKVKGFGQDFRFENLKYNFASKEIIPFLNKFDVVVNNLDPKIFKNFKLEGIATGSLSKLATKSIIDLENTKIVLGGIVGKNNSGLYFNGDLNVKNPDFLKLVNNLNFQYTPKVYALGLLSLDTKFKGNLDRFEAEIADLRIGQNSATGKIMFDSSSGRNDIKGNLDINQFEFERFFYNPAMLQNSDVVVFRKSDNEQADFLSKPFWDNVRFNYDFYNSFDLNLSLKIGKLIYKEHIFNDNSFNLVLKDGTAKISDFVGSIAKGKVLGSLEYVMKDNPNIKGDIELQKIEVDQKYWSGRKYGLMRGILGAKIKFNTDAVSTEDMAKNLNAEISFDVDDALVKGWNIDAINHDLLTRNSGDGLAALVKTCLENGGVKVNNLAGNLVFTNGDYSLNDTFFEGEGFSVAATGQGNLLLWDINSNMNLAFDDLQKFPPVDFGYKGALSSPTLEIDVSKIVKIYEDEKNEIISKQREAEKQKRDTLQKNMNENLSLTKVLEEKVDQELRQDAEKYLKELSSKIAKQEIENALVEIDNISKGVAEVIALGLTQQFDQELIDTIGRRNSLLSKRIDKVISTMNLAYMNDIKFKINNAYNEIVTIYNSSLAKNNEYKKNMDEFRRRVAQIETNYDVDTDPQVEMLTKKAEVAVITLGDVNSEMASEYVKIQSSVDASQLENYIRKIGELKEEAAENLEKLTDAADASKTYLDERVSAEEEEYRTKLREEEVRRKLEENTGKISVGGTGRSLTVIRDIEDIEKSEELKENEEIRVLDFSNGRVTNSVINQSGKKIEKKQTPNSGILIRREGDISGASGVIIRK